MNELIHHPTQTEQLGALEAGTGSALPGRPARPGALRTNNLGGPLRGDETSALDGAAPTQTVIADDGAPPIERRLGEGLNGDSQNFLGRPSASLAQGGGNASGAGGGSGL